MKQIYILPNLVTTGNLFSGFYSIIASIQGQFVLAAWMIVLASVFDLLDGRVARLAKATSPFGVEYDSLCDLVSFGMAPAILVYLWSLEPYGRLGWLTAFIYLACAAFRLARFNVSTEVVPKGYFVGLPSPVAANLISTFVIFNAETNWPAHRPLENFTLVGTLFVAILMSSRFLFPSFKELSWRSRAGFPLLLTLIVLIVMALARPEIMMFIYIAAYILVCSLWRTFPAIGRMFKRVFSDEIDEGDDDSQLIPFNTERRSEKK